MRLFLFLGSILLVSWGCAPRHLLRNQGGWNSETTAVKAAESLRVRGSLDENSQAEQTAFFPSGLEEAGLNGWNVETLRKAGYLVDHIEFENEGEYPAASEKFSGPEVSISELQMRRPPRRGGPGRPLVRRPPLLNPRSTPAEQFETQRRAAELEAVQTSRKLYFQRLAEAQSLHPNSTGHQEHHFVPIFLGGARSGVTYQLPTPYHIAITQEFRRHWSYGRGDKPDPEQLMRIMIKVYSKYPIPQLIGINP